MAITVDQKPSETQALSAFNPIDFLIDSDNTSEDNFAIVVKVYDDHAQSNQIWQGRFDTIPGSTRTLVRIGDVIRSIATNTLSYLVSGEQADVVTQALQEFSLNAYEYWCSGSVCDLQASGTVGDYYAARTAFKYGQEWIGSPSIDTAGLYLRGDYWATGWENYATVTTSVAVSAQTKFRKILAGQYVQIGTYEDSIQFIDTVQIDVWNEDFTLNRSRTLSPSLTTIQFWSLDIGTSIINSHTWSSALNLTTTDKYFTIVPYFSSLSSDFQALAFEIDWSPCTPYTQYELHWINRFGGWDSWVFNRKTEQMRQVTQTTYKQPLVPIVNGDAYSYDISRRTVRPAHTEYKDKYRLNTDNLREWEYKGLEHLLTSPEIYWNDNGTFRSVSLENVQEFVHHQDENGKTFNMSCTMVIDNYNETQW